MEQVRKLIAKVAPTNSTALDARRNRHRQGTGRPGAARSKPARRDAVRGHQLRRAARKPDRKRAVRPSQRQLHRRRRAPRRACSKWPTAARCFSTRSASCPRPCRPSCCECWKAARFAASARTSRSSSTCASSAPRIAHLEQMVDDGDFREDLMFRINTFEIPLPPLRERIDDIPRAGRHLIARFRPRRQAQDRRTFSPEALRRSETDTTGRATSANWPT